MNLWGDGMPLLPESFWRERFMVWAKFEKMKLFSDEVWMRPEARIVRIGSMNTFNSKGERTNAVIVIQNPGSRPISEVTLGQWTQAKPDQTQLQLMRLMEIMGWNELVIVNLSDLCEGDNIEFLALLKRCEIAGVVHSRFTDNPMSEWSSVIASADRLLYGWGGKKEAQVMANAYGLLDLKEMFTIHKKHTIAVWHPVKGYPKHPNPWRPAWCEEWCEDMVRELEVSVVAK